MVATLHFLQDKMAMLSVAGSIACFQSLPIAKCANCCK